jgi:hypothetical protein
LWVLTPQFAEAGGAPLLLRLYTLRHMPATFGSSAASHALLAALRALGQAHPALVTERAADALARHLRTTLLLAMVRHAGGAVLEICKLPHSSAHACMQAG